MVKGYYKIYKPILVENEIHEKIKMYKEIDTVELTIYELESYEAEKQGINIKGKVYNGICNSEQLEEGLYIEIFNLKYRIAKKRNYKTKNVVTFYEDNK